MPSSHLILGHPLFLLPPIPPSIRVICNESTLRMRWPKYWSFSFSIIPSKEHPGLISFRMDWLDLLANHRITLISLQHPTQYKSSLNPPSKSLSRSPGPIIVQFSHSVVPDSLRPCALQHTRLPNPSPTPGACSNSCPSSRWCYPIISSSIIPFSSCLQSFPAAESFLMSQFFTSGGQNIRVSASASVLPMNIQDWSPLGWTGWISLQSKGLSRVFSSTTVQKHQFLGSQLSL